jgi:PepSY-associated TM region
MSQPVGLLIRWLVLAHRYLGIAVGLLMVMWCLSGIVMMFVRYPNLGEASRRAALPPIDWHRCCTAGDVLQADRPVERLQIEMLAGHPVMRIAQTGEPARLIDLTDGQPVEHVTADQARSVALAYGADPQPPIQIDRDQWTVSGEFRRDRPLYRFDLADPAGTQLYVSSSSGRAVQVTTGPQRFWNWLGAIPHWLYFTRLRADVALWSQVVIWTSLLGCCLAGTGLYLGIRQLARAPGGRWSPYRGFMLWHHLPGMVFGLFVLTWVASGLISMNPWGFLDSEGGATAASRLQGPPPPAREITQALSALAAAAPASTVSIITAPFDGALYFIATASDGRRQRIDASGQALPPPDMVRAAELLGGSQTELLAEGDNYYFDRPGEAAALPVYRVVAGGVCYYLDPISGEVLRMVDGDGRWYRWLHEGLHRLDFSPVLRSRPIWDLLMLTLMLGVTAVCITGTWLGWRRLTR